jgi:hypothetical protein
MIAPVVGETLFQYSQLVASDMSIQCMFLLLSVTNTLH